MLMCHDVNEFMTIFELFLISIFVKSKCQGCRILHCKDNPLRSNFLYRDLNVLRGIFQNICSHMCLPTCLSGPLDSAKTQSLSNVHLILRM